MRDIQILRLRCCGKQRQDALETRPLNGFLVPNTSSPEPSCQRRKEHEEASIAFVDRLRSMSTALGEGAILGFGQETGELFGQGRRQRQDLNSG